MFTEKTVSVEELEQLYKSNSYDIEIDTPDGYQSIVSWFDKGVMGMVKIGTENHQTECAENHLVQLESGKWLLASELSYGDVILTTSGPEKIILVSTIDDAECFDFEVNHANHRYWGDGISSHNSGKSFIASGNVVKNAQDQGIYVVLIDSENALDESWLHALNVDTSEDKLLRLSMSKVDDVAKTIASFMKDYKEMDEAERPKILFVIDSLGALLTDIQIDQFTAGNMKGDFGHKPRALKSLVMNCVNMFGNYNVGLVATNHTYASQDMFDPDDKISGGSGPIYAASIVIAMKKLKLKTDADGVKTSKVHGIRAKCKIMKTRYNKPFEDAELQIPYETGMDPYSGMLDMFEEKGILVKQGNRLKYETKAGEEIIEFRKNWSNDKLQIVMNEYMDTLDNPEPVVEEIEPEEVVVEEVE